MSDNPAPRDLSRDLWDNPMGTDGFEFVEYTGPDPLIAQMHLDLAHTRGLLGVG